MTTRSERRAELRRKRRDRGDRRPRGREAAGSNWFTLLVVVVIVAGLGLAGFAGAQGLGLFDAAPGGSRIDPSAYRTTGPVGQKMADEGSSHLPQGQSYTEYKTTPPTSGPHAQTPTRWGVYRTQQPNEANVHALEHGGIVIGYNGIPPTDVEKLEAIRGRYPRDQYQQVKIIVHPYDKIAPGSIALTAWTWLDTMTGYDEERILRFIAAHMNQCCEAVP